MTAVPISTCSRPTDPRNAREPSPVRRPRLLVAVCVGLIALSFGSCRGGISEKPPIHPVLDMDFQPKVKAQMASDFPGFADQRGMRTPPAGTLASDALGEAPLHVFKDAAGNYVSNPLPATRDDVLRGQERFNVYCSACHDRSGAGQGLVLQRARVSSPAAFNYLLPDLGAEPRLRDSADGYFYEVITQGKGTMPAYGHQIPVRDRWCIVHYLRVLQARFQ
ncbi:MAG: cytochrome c [Planctomycetes bacterium]|nr:cytochrome c [Planctomycetota bacterium]